MSISKVHEQLSRFGINVDYVCADGNVHRVKDGPSDSSKSNWYVCHERFLPSTGESFCIAIFGSWRTGEKVTYCTIDRKLSSEESREIKKETAALEKKFDVEKENRQKEVAEISRKEWDEALDEYSRENEYLVRKCISTVAGLGIKTDRHTKNLLVPLCDESGKIWSIQTIGKEKMFKKGGRVEGLFHAIKKPKDESYDGVIYICEGLATAASVFYATDMPTIVAFDSGNIGRVGQVIRKKYKRSKIVFCGDDDRFPDKNGKEKPNAGKNSSEAAARKCFGVSVLPKFLDKDSKGTDFNDLHCLEGIDSVREQLLNAAEGIERQYFLALGIRDKSFFFTSSHNKQVISFNGLSKQDLLTLMPLEYWESEYPGMGAAKVDWDMAISSLMSQARKRGLFQVGNVRGAGVWMDDGRVVVNMGDHLIVDGVRVELGEIDSRYFYALGNKIAELHKEPLTAEECQVITDAAHGFRWKNPEYGFLLAGAIVTMRVCGGLPIRPHVWLTGERGSGKTTLFNRFIEPLIGNPRLFIAGNSTEAGIRQSVSADAIPVIIDEFETNGPKSADLIQTVLDLFRIAWSETRAVILKGSGNGQPQSFQARFGGIVSSIRQASLSDADQSRFATIELAPHNVDNSHWEKLDEDLTKIDEELGNRLFARIIRLFPVLLENYKVMKRVLAKRASGQRFGDQYGMILAGYVLLLQDEVCDEEQARLLANHVSLEEEVRAAEKTDQDDAWSQLLTTVVYDGVRERSIGSMLNERPGQDFGFARESDSRITLANLGIRVTPEHVIVKASNHAELQRRVWKDTKWSNAWGKALVRLDGAEIKTGRVEGPTARCVFIPIKHLSGK